MNRFRLTLSVAVLVFPFSLMAQTTTTTTTTTSNSLRSHVADLFRFGECGEALCLQVNAAVHGLHYTPSAQGATASLINFFTDAIGSSVSNIPISSSSGSVTFSMLGTEAVKSTVSSGPIFAERARTIGRGRLVGGLNVTSLQYKTFRGLPLNELEFNFTHQNVGSEVYGEPEFENDIIQVGAKIDLNLLVTTASFTYGLLDNLDIGVVIPIVHAGMHGTSLATVFPFGATSPHFFGTDENRSETSTGTTNGSSIGLGDVAARAKLNLTNDRKFAIFGDVRLPTGDADEFRGSGAVSVRALGVYSTQYRDMSPHANVGVLVRTGDTQKNAFLTTLGFDQLVSESLTFAADLLAEVQLGDNVLAAPEPVVITSPFNRSITPTNLPSSKDHVVSTALGFKYKSRNGVTAFLNALVPVRAGSLQPAVTWTTGLEINR
ncbi:MAG: hypothetical protein ABJB74_05135 [Gemmatimonas sp.]